MKRRILFTLWLFVGTIVFLYWWFNSLTAMLLDERLWSFYLHVLDSDHPANMDAAMDLEMLTVLVIGFGISYWVGRFLFHPEKEFRLRGLYRLWLLFGVGMFIFIWGAIESTALLTDIVDTFYTKLSVRLGGDGRYSVIWTFLTLVAVGALLAQSAARLYFFVKSRRRTR